MGRRFTIVRNVPICLRRISGRSRIARCSAATARGVVTAGLRRIRIRLSLRVGIAGRGWRPNCCQFFIRSGGRRSNRTGRLNLSNILSREGTCDAEEKCGRPILARRLCSMHYERKRRYARTGGPGRQALIHLLPPPTFSATVHYRVYRLWGSASQYACVSCGRGAAEWAYDGTDPAELYRPVSNQQPNSWQKFSRYPEFYKPLCKSCHRTEDKAKLSAELHEYRLWKHQTGLTVKDL